MAHSGKLCNTFEDRPFKPGISVFPNADCADRTCDGVPCGQPDWVLKGDSFRTDNWIRGWIITQLLTQARADPCDVPDNVKSLRGWWADSFRTTRFVSGSKLWTLSWDRSVNSTLTKARFYAQDALSPLMSWKIADTIEVTATYKGKQTIALSIVVTGPRVTKTQTVDLVGSSLPDMSWLWKTETGAL